MIRFLFLFGLLFSHPAHSLMDIFNFKNENNYDKNKNEYFSTQSKDISNNKELTKSDHKNNLSSDMLGNDTVADLKNKILSADHLLKKAISEQKKTELKIFKTITFVQMARKIRIQGKGKKLSAEEQKYLNLAKQEALAILNQQGYALEKKKYLYYILGLIYMDLEDKEKSIQSFELSINNPKNEPYVTVISLYLGDLYFEEGSFDKAFEKYHQFYNQLNPKDKDYVQYKTAWIYIKKNDFRKALSEFFEILKKGEKEIYYKDAISSLAFLLPDEFDQEQIIGIVDDAKIAKEQKNEILYYTYFNLIKLPSKKRDKIFSRIVTQDMSQDKKIKIYIQECILLLDKKESKTEVEKIYFYLADIMSKKINTKHFIASNEFKLVQDIGEIIIEARLKDLNSKSNSFKVDSETLKKVIYQQLAIENRANKKEELNLLVFGIEYQSSNYLKVTEIFNKANSADIAKNRFSKKFLKSISDYNFNSILKLYEVSPKEWSEKYLLLLEEKSKDPQLSANEQQQYRNKKLEILVKQENWKSAYDLVKDSSLVLLKTDELEKVSYLAFKNNDCDKISNIKKISSQNQKVIQYLKECRLNMAERAKGDKTNFNIYEKNIISFILESPEDEKKYIAVNDYFNQLMQQNKADKIERVLLGSKINILHPKILPWIYETSFRYAAQANWSKSLGYTKKVLKNNDLVKLYQSEKSDEASSKLLITDILRLDLINSFAIEKNYLSTDFLQKNGYSSFWLSQDNVTRLLFKYFDQQIVLLNPKLFLDHNKKNDYQSSDRNDLLLASELLEIHWSRSQDQELYKLLKDLLPLDKRQVQDYPSYNYLNSLNLEMKDINIQTKFWDDTTVAKRVEKTRNSRDFIKKDLSQVSVGNALIILSLAKQAEQATAQIVLHSKLPGSLSNEQQVEYKSELKKIAEEFTSVSKEYEKLENNMYASKNHNLNTNSQIQKNAKNEKTAKESTSKVPNWPKGYANEEFIKNLISQKKWWDIIIVADLLSEKKWINKNIFCQIRHNSLLSLNPSKAMQDYVSKEKGVLKCN